jgi:hypothetical protein
MRRIELLLGSPLGAVDVAALQTLVTGSVREDGDLEFKQQLYGSADSEKRDLAGDVAAMANTVGGVIVLGISETDGAATGLYPVALSEAEELRMRQVVTGLVAPAPQFTIYRVEQAAGTPSGFYLLAVPRSADAPHAVRVHDGLRYPRRDGPRIRWLSESEVSDAYRSRFQQAASHVERLEGMLHEGAASLHTEATAWLALALSPLNPGHMEIRQRTVAQAQDKWMLGWTATPTGFGNAVFRGGGFAVSAGVGRIALASGRNQTGKVTTGLVEFHQDGSAFGASLLWSMPASQQPDGGGEQVAGAMLGDESLVNAAVSTLGLAVDHATRRCGAVGDAIVVCQILTAGDRPYTLAHSRQGYPAPFDGARAVYSFPRSRHQLNLEECQHGTGLLVGARMLLTDLVQFVGLAEVTQITPDGALRKQYFLGTQFWGVEQWANAQGAQIVDTLLDFEP